MNSDDYFNMEKNNLMAIMDIEKCLKTVANSPHEKESWIFLTKPETRRWILDNLDIDWGMFNETSVN